MTESAVSIAYDMIKKGNLDPDQVKQLDKLVALAVADNSSNNVVIHDHQCCRYNRPYYWHSNTIYDSAALNKPHSVGPISWTNSDEQRFVNQ